MYLIEVMEIVTPFFCERDKKLYSSKALEMEDPMEICHPSKNSRINDYH